IAAFFYLRLIVVMYMAAPTEEGEEVPAAAPAIPIPVGAGLALAIAAGFTLVVGFLPEAVITFARHATLLRL
ncbi:MAG: hypothetical protein JO155_06515, partial [Acidimicrobiia bacterium]|nr:hypothetical protein [Acidimicrobiia bacterium]